MDLDKYKLYDSIVSSTYVNIAIDAMRNNGIFFNSFDNNSYEQKVFLKVAFTVAPFENKKIYINCKFFDFLKIFFNNYNIKKLIFGKCYLRFKRKPNKPNTDIKMLAAFEVDSFKAEIEEKFENQINIFEEIWKEYYQK